MRTYKLLLMSLFTLLIILPLISSAPPVLSLVQPGSLEILAPTYQYVQVGLDKDIYWHVFNTTKLLTNTSVTCYYHLYSQNLKGEHIVTVNNVKTFINGRDFEVEVKGANFTIGEYCHLIECNTSTQTGGLERCFTVSANSNIMTVEDSMTFNWQIAILLLTVILFIVMGIIFKIDSVKIFFFVLAGLTLFMLIGLSLSIAQNYLSLYTNYITILSAYYIIFAVVGGVGIIGLIIWFLYYVLQKFSKTKIGDFDED